MRILVIGAGLFGCCAAYELAKSRHEVDLIEQDGDIMQRASRCNHNRIHLGYHYLRSVSTAEQSMEGMISFLFHFGDAVVHQFPNYYAIAKEGSKTSSAQFANFCDEVGIGYEEEYPEERLLDRTKIDCSFRVPEPVFDYETLQQIVWSNLRRYEVRVHLKECCNKLERTAGGFAAELTTFRKEYDYVINATYSQTNRINAMLGIPPRPLLYEDVLIPVFAFEGTAIGLTVMDGPFCSVMPRGRRKNEFLLYHVEESVLQSRLGDVPLQEGDDSVDEVNHIYARSQQFMPFLADVKPLQHYRTVRTVHENSDDARLSEIHNPLPNYWTVLSGKVTTCVQSALEIKHQIQGKKRRFRI